MTDQFKLNMAAACALAFMALGLSDDSFIRMMAVLVLSAGALCLMAHFFPSRGHW